MGIIEVAYDFQNMGLRIFSKFTVTVELYEEVRETCRKTFLIQKQHPRTILPETEQ